LSKLDPDPKGALTISVTLSSIRTALATLPISRWMIDTLLSIVLTNDLFATLSVSLQPVFSKHSVTLSNSFSSRQKQTLVICALQ
jgi:hypothetical protein